MLSFKLLRSGATRVLHDRKGLAGLQASGWTLRGVLAAGDDARPDRLTPVLRDLGGVPEVSLESCETLRDLAGLADCAALDLTIKSCTGLRDLSALREMPRLREL